MYLMGLHDEFNRAVRFVEHSNFTQPAVRPRLLQTNIINSLHLHTQSQGVYAPFFETVIRYLGGLLSAYALSRDTILLQRADDLGRLLSPAFGTDSGFPDFGVSTST
jgi:mannosyl-oligosaccharide alpha-1,2-mannosidase